MRQTGFETTCHCIIFVSRDCHFGLYNSGTSVIQVLFMQESHGTKKLEIILRASFHGSCHVVNAEPESLSWHDQCPHCIDPMSL